MDTKLGIVAGDGNLPFIVARNARKQGITSIYAAAFAGQTDPSLENYVDRIKWVGLGQLNKLIDFFTANGVKKAVFIGRVAHKVVFSNLKLDFKMIQLAMKIKDWRTDSILGAIVEEITRSGVEIIDSTTYLKELLPGPAILTKRKPSKQEQDDIRFGFFIAKNLAGLDVGQTVVVKKKTVCALEAVEGTDETILRGGKLGKKNVVVVKVAKPHQDMRFDVPVVGTATLEKLREANASVLAIEAGRTLLLEQDELVTMADKHNMSIVVADPSQLGLSEFEKSVNKADTVV